ncbi:hypothetical protein [Cupriavidus basilensis]|nr:hypothetical protein [Cupriavidus basilensis]
MLDSKTRYRIHECLAEHFSFIQYPSPRAFPLDNRPTGLRRLWIERPRMPIAVAMIPPPLMLFIPVIGVYLSIAYLVFLFIYFKRT